MGKYCMNKESAKSWIVKSWHHYKSGVILYDALHYTDTIAVDLHYAIEIMLKSLLAYDNKKIIKTHDLVEIYDNIKQYIDFNEDELLLLDIITTYHIKESYPALDRTMPSRNEIKEVLEFTKELLERICKILKIDISRLDD